MCAAENLLGSSAQRRCTQAEGRQIQGKLRTLPFVCTRIYLIAFILAALGGSVAEWLACWTQAQKGPGSNRSRDAVGEQS